MLGGKDSSGDYVTSIERLPEGASSWQTVSGHTYEGAHGAAFSLGDDIIAVLGGRAGLDGKFWLYNLADDYTAVQKVFEGIDHVASTYHHGRLYTFGGNDDPTGPGPDGESTARKFHLHGCTPGSPALMPGWCARLYDEEDLLVYDYSSGTDGTSASFWRGYRFELSTPRTVTTLYGGPR